ncbi:hypothetical protein AYO41_02080 [Verrucomicrobia bacterium SCGC AG-212-E04]|nr:hypothetical protein AYO41_02080 [Verrucomicrobia bacterium SCGC AG-212-E04]
MAPIELDLEDGHYPGIWDACQPSNMASFELGLALFRSIRYLHQNFIDGDFVEYGVQRGDSSTVAMRTLQHFDLANRRFWLLDELANRVASTTGQAVELENANSESLGTKSIEVRPGLATTDYDQSLIARGSERLLESIVENPARSIALLRLDTGDYENTLMILRNLYPRLVPGGILFIDQFGKSKGTRKAVDEYFDDLRRAQQVRPFFNLIATGGSVAIRPPICPTPIIERRDYFPPGLKRSDLLAKFSGLVARDPVSLDWPYLRKTAPHVWRSDARSTRLPDTGVLSVEEAELLYNNALQFSGQRGLEIGCHYGWSTAHLLAAGLLLDVVDPALQFQDQREDVKGSLALVETAGSFQLWPGFSPAILPAIRSTQLAPWSFVLIDGYHEGDSPRMDANEVAGHCADSACVILHDLVSPFVAAGLRHFASLGWSTGLYNTMQIMGIAWRGNAQPVKHVADPCMPKIDHSHLKDFEVLSL